MISIFSLKMHDDSNIPVTFDPDTKKLVTPEVQSWSELMGETEFFPCKWVQDPSNVMVRSPALALIYWWYFNY